MTKKKRKKQVAKKEKSISLGIAFAALIANILIPGIGTLIAGKISSGVVQLFIFGLGLITTFIIGWTGIAALIIAWAWAFATSLIILKNSRK